MTEPEPTEPIDPLTKVAAAAIAFGQAVLALVEGGRVAGSAPPSPPDPTPTPRVQRIVLDDEGSDGPCP